MKNTYLEEDSKNMARGLIQSEEEPEQTSLQQKQPIWKRTEQNIEQVSHSKTETTNYMPTSKTRKGYKSSSELWLW